MTSDDIIRSFLNLHPDTPMDNDEYIFSLREIKQVVEAAVKAERIACAMVCEENWHECGGQCANVIRARGQE